MRPNRRDRPDMSVAWIAYADFLATLAVVFLLLASRNLHHLTVIQGMLHDPEGRPVQGASIVLGSARSNRTGPDGAFKLTLGPVVRDLKVEINSDDSVPLGTYSINLGGNSNVDIEKGKAAKTDVVELPGDQLFDTGKDTLTPEGRRQLASQVGKICQNLSGRNILLVVGHADIAPYKFDSLKIANWRLSSARALAAAQFLMDQQIAPRNRIMVAALGDQHPKHSKSLLSENRRIEFRRVDDGIPLGATFKE